MKLMTLFQESSGKLSWGRVCSAVALLVAIYGQVRMPDKMDIAHLAAWLGVALGNYGANKITEILTKEKPS